MLYSDQKSLGYLAALQLLEDAHTEAFNKETEKYLMEAMTVKKGDVVDVQPVRGQYFSRGERFLILSVTAHVGRDKDTGHFAGIVPALIGVFLDQKGDPIQSVRFTVKPGHLHTESLPLKDAKWLRAPITQMSADQTHNVEISR
jgi:hypothetical protein